MTPRPWWRCVPHTSSYNDTPLSSWQIYLPAIEGYVPDDMIKALRAFLEFCYLAHCNIHNRKSLDQMDEVLQCYHHYRKVFLATGVWMGFNLPRQHALVHYIRAIWLFGAPNGLCSSIIESKHIKAVKEPWWRSSRFDALCQMLLSNQRTDKLALARADFKKQGMLKGTCLSWILVKLGTFLCLYYWVTTKLNLLLRHRTRSQSTRPHAWSRHCTACGYN